MLGFFSRRTFAFGSSLLINRWYLIRKYKKQLKQNGLEPNHGQLKKSHPSLGGLWNNGTNG